MQRYKWVDGKAIPMKELFEQEEYPTKWWLYPVAFITCWIVTYMGGAL